MLGTVWVHMARMPVQTTVFERYNSLCRLFFLAVSSIQLRRPRALESC